MAGPSLPPLPLPQGISQSYLPSLDLTYHYLSAGVPSKPLLLLLHGFPELAFSWRKIMVPLANLGYHVVAYDQRGYGRTTGWDTREYSTVDLNTFSFVRLVRDAVIFVSALGYKDVACVIGHDFGAVSASLCALMRPDIFKSLIMMSHPFRGAPQLPFNTKTPPAPPTGPDIQAQLASLPQPRKHYKQYYSTAPAAHEMLEPKPELHAFLRGYFHLKSADWSGNQPRPLKAWTAEELAQMPYYYIPPLESNMREAVAALMSQSDPGEVEKSPRWLPDAELAVYAQEWARTGFQGGLNWYRVSTAPEKYMLDVELFAGRKVVVPCVFVAGKSDWGTYQERGAVEALDDVCEQFWGTELVDGAGHWVQQEQAEKMVDIAEKFLAKVKKEAMSY
ncbi:hypothetical protein BP6252_11813 [Coleophoma cylindrospora]|uniref:AB hydrolase-1 domain-containing protein n=1 Tax=Coleophoma cylindrospora TaxID=1849047 RepID=A0A3D8QL42_9HELO|nr:hypothetical protein BP6252_11813 [Coleophoma cylindrospora]